MTDAPALIINLPGYPFNNLQSVADLPTLRAIPSGGLENGQDIAVDAGGLFAWFPGSTASDDGLTVIKPTDLTPLQAGRWLAASKPAFDLKANAADLINKAATDFSNLAAADSETIADRSYLPLGNELPTFTRVALRGSDKYDDQREFLYAYGFSFTHGGGGDPSYQWDKCAQYIGGNISGKVKQAWVRNDLMGILPPANPAVNSYNFVCGYELDINNVSGFDFGAADGAAGIVAPSMHMIHVNGSGTNTLTSGYCIISSRAGGASLVERGFMAGPASVRQADFDSYSNSAAVVRASSGAHNFGIDLRGATFASAAMITPQGSPIASLNTSGALTRTAYVAADNTLHLGDAANNTNVVVERTLLPSVDNQWQLGSSSQRWSSVWAVNGAIQTSDATLKTDILEVDAAKASAMVDALTPKSYRWIVGGKSPIMGTEKQQVLVSTEKVSVELPTPRNSSEPSKVVEVDCPVYEEQDVPVVTGYDDIAGKRTHYGFLACDVKAAVDTAGLGDFAGYVKDADGIEAIRPDQLMAVLWTEVRSLRARVAALEAKA